MSKDDDDFHKIPSDSLLLVDDDDDDNRLKSWLEDPMTKYDGGVTTE